MLLSLDTRGEAGRVTVVRCKGRMVASESESLRAHIAWLLRDRRSIVLDLGEVGFVDSSGLGTMVRALTNTRQAHGDLKLCNVPEFVRKVLEMSRLNTVFDSHESEEKAVAANFYLRGARAEAPVRTGRSVLSGCSMLTSSPICANCCVAPDTTSKAAVAWPTLTMLLMRITHFDLLLTGPGMSPTPASPPAFREACAKLPMIELGAEFSTSHAGKPPPDCCRQSRPA